MKIKELSETKDLRIGTVFEYGGAVLQIVGGERSCRECYFTDSRLCSKIPCLHVYRKDDNNIIFKELK